MENKDKGSTKMKKHGLSIGLLSLLIAGGLAPTVANAAAVEKASVESDVKVEVVEGDAEGDTEEDITEKPQNGSNFLIKGVSDFDFKQIPLGETRAASFLEKGGKNYSHGIEVADVTGDGTGWKVQVKMKSFVISEGTHKDEVLKGWTLKIPTEKVTSKSSPTDVSAIPTGQEVTISGDTSAVVFQADQGKGMGRYTNMFETYKPSADPKRKTGVQLSIPITARKASYAGKLEWKLYNVPGVSPEP